MATVEIFDFPDELHRGLILRATKRGHSLEAEVRDILTAAVLDGGRVKLGTMLHKISRELGLTAEDLAVFDDIRDDTPATAQRFLE
jgi:plasmid stability protein